MSLSDIERAKRQTARAAAGHLAAAAVCALFGVVYELFSFGVYSGYMLFAFLIPLCPGAVLLGLMRYAGVRRLPGRAALNLYNAGIATLTVGSLCRGALEIYGTSNPLLAVYWRVGAALLALGMLLYAARPVRAGR